VYYPDVNRKLDLRFAKDVCVDVGDVVERHLKDGDVVVFNRQPTLHRMSMMGHFVRVMTGDTFRLNLSATTPYNADFDGDEMNMHVPQNIESRVEVKELMMVSHNIVSPQSNKPVMGVVQDALLACRLATKRDVFIDKASMANILMTIGVHHLPVPAIQKPKALWTGKQLFSCIMPKQKVHQYSAWHADDDTAWFSVNDTELFIDYDGYFVSGILCKKSIGQVSNGIIHKAWLYDGPTAACDFVSNIQMLANHWLLHNGFSIGVEDCVTTVQSQFKVDELITHSLNVASDPSLREMEVNHHLNQARDRSGRYVATNMKYTNSLQNMVSSGSKGNVINIAQIMACVGQQNVNGQRIPLGYRYRSLPHYVRHDNGYESRGFVKHSYMNGLTPTEFFFHAMGGREGVIDTAIKTSETGYIQRRLIKAMEDVKVEFDNTVRNSLGEVLQITYGEDGFDGSRLITQKINGRLVHLPLDVNREMDLVDRLPMKTKPIPFDPSLIADVSNELHHKVLSEKLHTVRWDEYKYKTFVRRYNDLCRCATVAPGEMVGTIAAQSLGQPITQMTLNTFHAAGISANNVTVGVPRLKELINLSKNIKSPSMRVALKTTPVDDVVICDRVLLLECVKRWTVVETSARTEFEVDYVSLMGISAMQYECQWVIHITLNTEFMRRNGVTIERLMFRLNTAVACLWCTQNCDQVCIRSFENSMIDNRVDLETTMQRMLNELIIKGCRHVLHFYECDADPLLLVTDGTDLQTIVAHPCVDPLRTSTNDVFETFQMLGIEAARRLLLRELRHVIEYDGSYLNYRHLSILLDVMTHKGTLMAITRHGINRTETGVLMRCSFEETVNIILDAASMAEVDPIRGVTENIIMGKLASIGTGCVDIMSNFSFDTQDEAIYRPPSPSPIQAVYNTAYCPPAF
jgi:DNA-directed RNA polymerase beta' subunit